MRTSILLFDMDDVLLQPGGYHRALSETIQQTGRSLGFKEVTLTSQDIAHYEAAGSTSEWDTAAICAALLLKRVWTLHPEVRLPSENGVIASPPHNLPPPDLRAFARDLAQAGMDEVPTLKRAEGLLTARNEGLSMEQRQVLQAILRNARRFEHSLTFRTFQELVLGSQKYSQAYDTLSTMQVESTLLRFDRTNLTAGSYQWLQTWLDQPNHGAAIITNRPTLVPDGSSGTPEAEIGAQLVGLEQLPLVGLGALSWRSALDGLDPEAYLKPSPVHAMTGLLMALGESIEPALEKAISLDHGGHKNEWQRLQGSHVWVFEDSIMGMRSAQQARKILAAHGVNFELSLCGITKSAPKRESLLAAGARVYSNLNDALSKIPD